MLTDLGDAGRYIGPLKKVWVGFVDNDVSKPSKQRPAGPSLQLCTHIGGA